MSYRDSSGKTTRNPYSFLQNTKIYKTKVIKPLTDEEIKVLNFELNWAKIELDSGIDLGQIIFKYFKHYYKLKHHSKDLIEINSILLLSPPNYSITLCKKDFNFQYALYDFLNSVLDLRVYIVESIDNLNFTLTHLFRRNLNFNYGWYN